MEIGKKMKGKFVVLEGIDGTGKTTACKKIKKFLESKGHKVILTAEPTDSKLGEYIRNTNGLSPEVEALLFVADRGMHTEKIREKLSKGYFVVCDRYYLSTLAYQSASGMDLKWLETINSKVIIEPDVTIVLDADPEIGLERVGKRGKKSRFEKLAYQKKVRKVFLDIAKKKKYKVIDASGDLDEMTEEIIKHVSKKV